MYLKRRYLTRLLYYLSISFFGLVIKYFHAINDLYFSYTAEETNLVFDYIIVGSGSSGSIVARRLSDNKQNQVLVLEAGQDVFDFLNIPSLGLLLQKTSYDWQYSTVSQENACLGLNNYVSQWPMGKIVGGTAMFNNLIHIRGHRGDFDEWFKSKDNYNYDIDILRYFKKLEKQDSADSDGSVYTGKLKFTTVLPKFILRAAKSLGWPVHENMEDSKLGVGIPKVNIHNSSRWTTASTLKSLTRPNLILKTNRMVKKILFRNDYEAVGVEYVFLNKNYYARARKGVILSAGVIGSPKILMLSGIGKKNHLDKINIKTKVNLPVGDNLQDHITTGFDLVLLNQTLDLSIESMLSPVSALSYFMDGSGPWTTVGCEAVALFNTKGLFPIINNFTSQRPDLQFMAMPLGITEDDGLHLRKLIGISDTTWDNYFALNGSPAITILPILLHPKSRGTVRLADKNVLSQPIINPRYLSNQEDIEVLINGIQIIKQLVQTEEMSKLGAKFNTNIFPGCETFEFDTKPYWECYIRYLTITAYHPVGTCKMGDEKDSTSVVGYDFKVKGTNNLFVVDGSTLPTLSSGNVNAPIMLMAEIASDAIKWIDHMRNETCHKLDLLMPKYIC